MRAEASVELHIRQGTDSAADLHAQAGVFKHTAHLAGIDRLFLLRTVQVDHVKPAAAAERKMLRCLQNIVRHLGRGCVIAPDESDAFAADHIYCREQDHFAILQKFRSIVSPASPLFSGWNWQPNTCPRPTTAGTGSPYSASARTTPAAVSAL